MGNLRARQSVSENNTTTAGLRLLVVGLLSVLFLYGCGGRKTEYIEDCEHVGRKLYFTEQMVYLSGLKKRNYDPLTYKINRMLAVLVYDNGKKNSDIYQFGLETTTTDQNTFTVRACYRVIPYGYIRSFASDYSAFVLRDENGLLSTTLATIIEEKHWESPRGGCESLDGPTGCDPFAH